MAHVQHRSQRVASGANALAFSSDNTLGNLLWLYVLIEDGTSTISSVADSRNGAWTAIGTIKRSSGSAGSLQLFYRKNCGAGANTVTVTPSAGAITIGIHEESGYDTTAPLTDSSDAEGFTTDSPDSGVVTTTTANELVAGAVVANRLVTEGSGFTKRVSEDFNLTSISEDKTAVVAGDYHLTASLSIIGSWIACAASFKLSGAPSDPPPTPPITHRNTIVEPTLPTLGAANTTITDPSFGTRILRVTDENTVGSAVGSSHGNPSASHQNAWRCNSNGFYVRSQEGGVLIFDFNQATMSATRNAIVPTLSFNSTDPQFSWNDPDIVYTTSSDGAHNDHATIQKCNLSTGVYTTILNLGTIAITPLGATRTYCGSLFSSETDEKVCISYGGTAADLHIYAAVFPAATPSTITIVDTLNSRISINGAAFVSTSSTLGFKLHHVQIDRTGRYVILELAVPYSLTLPPKYVWDTLTNTFTAVSPYPEAHTAVGWGDFINQYGPDESPYGYDNIKLTHRYLNAIGTTRSLMTAWVTTPETYVDGHTSWNNARSTSLQPIFAEVYRSQDGPSDVPHNNAAFRAWDNEIVAFQVSLPSGANTVWRQCHHRSLVYGDDGTSTGDIFQYQPRAIISPNGKWCNFTSNWGKGLGNQLTPATNQSKRYDVFMVEVSPVPTADVVTTFKPAWLPATPPIRRGRRG